MFLPSDYNGDKLRGIYCEVRGRERVWSILERILRGSIAAERSNVNIGQRNGGGCESREHRVIYSVDKRCKSTWREGNLRLFKYLFDAPFSGSPKRKPRATGSVFLFLYRNSGLSGERLCEGRDKSHGKV